MTNGYVLQAGTVNVELARGNRWLQMAVPFGAAMLRLLPGRYALRSSAAEKHVSPEHRG